LENEPEDDIENEVSDCDEASKGAADVSDNDEASDLLHFSS